MTLTIHERRARALIAAAADDPSAATQMVYSWSPIELRQVAIALAQSVVLTAPGVVPRYEPRTPRMHGIEAGPHRCDREECADMNRAWETEYRRSRRAAGLR